MRTRLVGAPGGWGGGGINQGRWEGGGGGGGGCPKQSCQKSPGQSGEKKTDQLSVHVRRLLHNCITSPSTLPPATDCISSIFFYMSHMLCVLTVACDNKVTHEWMNQRGCSRFPSERVYLLQKLRQMFLEANSAAGSSPRAFTSTLTEHLNLSALQCGLKREGDPQR